ncbi:hypothetical protein [Streptomyces sp. AN091965]|uniref:hypothetical protein n=1 Tax=Streptomyces sp. AN091965 TaxID=2927803 RepID=UPI0035A820C0
MDVEAWVFTEPVPDLGGVVGGVIVTDQVDIKPVSHGLVDPGQELLELDCPVAAVELGSDGAISDVEGGEQTGDAVPVLVVCAPLGHARHHRQDWLRAVQRLDLGLLVDA